MRINACNLIGHVLILGFGAQEVQQAGWNPSIRIQGQVYHKIGSLLPPSHQDAKFLQVYFLDSVENEISARSHSNLNPEIIDGLTTMLHENNQYVREIKTAKEVIDQHSEPTSTKKIVIREDRRPQGEHARRYNAPTSHEVAVLMENEPTEHSDIVLRTHDGALKRISEIHHSYDALQYPLILPFGTNGYNIYMEAENGRKITALQFYTFHFMDHGCTNYLLLGRRLYQQYLVDMYCKIETERLQWFKREQKTLRADSYTSLRDSLLASDGDPRQVGQRIVLPATFTGGQ